MSPYMLHNFGEYFIIESPTRGTFREWDHDEDKPRFSTSGARDDADKTMRFRRLQDAEAMLAKIHSKVKTKNCYIADARFSFEKVGTTEHRYMVHGYIYEPGDDNGSDKQGYIHFYDIISATSEDKAKVLAEEDYGDYNTIEVAGIAKDKKHEEDWLRKNPD